jgi:hypothetical protein
MNFKTVLVISSTQKAVMIKKYRKFGEVVKTEFYFKYYDEVTELQNRPLGKLAPIFEHPIYIS